jgi:hypothetical protein
MFSRASSIAGIIAAQLGGDAVESGEQAPLIDGAKVKLIADITNAGGGDDEGSEGIREVVSFEDLVEAAVFGGAEGEGAGLDREPLRHSGGFEDANELLLASDFSIEELPGGGEGAFFEKGVEVLHEEDDVTQAELVVDCFPIEAPNRAVCIAWSEGGKVGANKGRVGPIEEASGQAVVFGNDHYFPQVLAVFGEKGFAVADEVAEEVLFEVGFSVGLIDAAEAVEAGEEVGIGIGDAPVDGRAAVAAAGGVWLAGRSSIKQVAEAFDFDGFQSPPSLVP